MFKDNLGKSPFRQYTKYKEIGSKPEKKTHTHINAVIEQLMQKKNSRRRE